MAHAPTHDGNGNGALKPPRPAGTIVRHHRGRTEEEALERFHKARARERSEGLYPIALSFSNGEVTGRHDEVELAVTYLRRA